MKTIQTITICSSAQFYSHVLDVEKELKKLGYSIKVPKTARIMQKNSNFDVAYYKTWFGNKEDYKKKQALMDAHFKKVLEADAILIVNDEKHGMPGYIGGNVLMEMVVAYMNKKPIFILNEISEKLPVLEEVYGLYPIFLNGSLNKLPQ